MKLTTSIMITTKDRVPDLKRTSEVLLKLNPPPLEILVTADGCTDGTVEFVKSVMPHARLFVNERSKGSVASRDRMMREARGDLVLSLDDDSYPEQTDCILRFSLMFHQQPKLAVAHFPQHTDEFPSTLTQTDFGPARHTRSFANSGAVLRRSTYLELPGFEQSYFHIYEEPDYSLQCVAAGHEVLFAPVVTIRHHYSGRNRDEIRIHQRHARNECWSTLIRCPFPYVIGIAAYRVLSHSRYALARGLEWFIREPTWWWEALKGVPNCLKRRDPIPWVGYKSWLRLK